jgi:5'-3' exonuclease
MATAIKSVAAVYDRQPPTFKNEKSARYSGRF